MTFIPKEALLDEHEIAREYNLIPPAVPPQEAFEAWVREVTGTLLLDQPFDPEAE